MLVLLGSSNGGVMHQAQRGDFQQRASFMPKGELLTWLNGLLHLDYTRVEQCSNGAAYCQVLDSLFVDEFPLRRVSFTAKAEHESIKNYKVLQQFFMRKGISKTIDVDKLIKGRPMDNLEFLQWLRGFFEEHRQADGEYDALARRRSCGLVCSTAGGRGVGSRASTVSPRVAGSPSPYRGAGGTGAGVSYKGGVVMSRSPGPNATPRQGGSGVGSVRTPLKGANKAFDSPPLQTPLQTPEPQGAQGQLRVEVEALQHTVAELEKERDFYYGKLRSVELLCQTTEESPQAPESVVAICKEILGVMYADNDDDAEKDDDGDLAPEEGNRILSPEPAEPQE